MSADIYNAYKFAGRLNTLIEKQPINTAALAKLRRGLRDSFEDVSPDIPSWLMECVEDPASYGKFALVGSLFAYHSMPAQEPESLGESFAKHKGSDSLEKRFKSLLEARGDELIHRLREIVGLAKSQELPIHYGILLRDILAWDDFNQPVQFRWAIGYWRDLELYDYFKKKAETDWENEKKSSDQKTNRELSLKELQARLFVKYLQDLQEKENKAALAYLRHGSGKSYGPTDMLPYVAPFLPEDRPWEYPAYFLTASLFALHPAYTEEPYHNMGRVFHLLAEKQTAKEATQSLQRRFTALLDADQRDIAHHLRQVISEAKSAKSVIKINYRQLLLDLLGWGNPNKTVQRHWAKSFFFFDPKSISNIP